MKKREKLTEFLKQNDLLSILDLMRINYSVIDVDGNYIMRSNTMKQATNNEENAAKIDLPAWEDCKIVMKSGQRAVREEKYLDKHYFSIKQPIIQNGECLGIMILGLDIAEHKKETQLLDLAISQTITSLLDMVGINYSVVDLNGDYIIQNNTMQKVVEKKINAAEIDPPTWQDCLEVMKSGEQAIREEQYQDKYFFSVKQPIIENGKAIGIIVLSFDITDRKKAEEYKLEKEKAEQTVRFLEVLAGSIAHELKTPLAAINLQLDLIKNSCHPTIRTTYVKEEEREKIFTVGMNLSKYLIRSASTMINLVLSKIKYLVLGEIDKSTFGYFTMVGEVFDSICDYPFLPGEKEKVHFDHKLSLNFQYYGDPVFTRHLLFNLIKNALKAIKIKEESMHVTRDQEKETKAATVSKPKRIYFIGKPTFKKLDLKEKEFAGGIFIDIRPGKEYNELVFMDTGVGMPPEVIDSLFQSYYSKDAAKEGTGLGLAFCKLIMETYGGDISCRSKEGEFTEFVMRFPVVKPQKPKLKIDLEFEAI